MPEGGEWNRIVQGHHDDVCPIAGCGRRIGRRAFLCPDHWRDVPYLLKGQLREAAGATRSALEGDELNAALARWRVTAVEVVRVVEAG